MATMKWQRSRQQRRRRSHKARRSCGEFSGSNIKHIIDENPLVVMLVVRAKGLALSSVFIFGFVLVAER